MLYTTTTTLLHAVFRLLFTLEYYGEENVPERGPVIIAGNHPSYLDPVLVTLPLERRVFFMAWDRLFKVPVLGALMRGFGAFPVRRLWIRTIRRQDMQLQGGETISSVVLDCGNACRLPPRFFAPRGSVILIQSDSSASGASDTR